MRSSLFLSAGVEFHCHSLLSIPNHELNPELTIINPIIVSNIVCRKIKHNFYILLQRGKLWNYNK